MVDWVPPRGAFPDGAHRLPSHGDTEGLGAVGVEGGAAAALASQRSEQSHHLVRRLVRNDQVELPDISAQESARKSN